MTITSPDQGKIRPDSEQIAPETVPESAGPLARLIAFNDNSMVSFEVEKSVLLFWGWIGFGIAIMSFYYPVLPGLSFIALAVWAILKSSPHLGMKIVQHPKILPHLTKLSETRDVPRNIKIAISLLLCTGATYIATTEGRLALVAFGLFVCLPIASLLWRKPFGYSA